MTFILKGIGDLATNTKPEHVLRSVSGAQQEIWWLVEWCWRSLAPIYSPSPKYTNAPLHLASSPFFVFCIMSCKNSLMFQRSTVPVRFVRIGCVALLANDHHQQQQHTKPEHDGPNSTPLPGKRDVTISSGPDRWGRLGCTTGVPSLWGSSDAQQLTPESTINNYTIFIIIVMQANEVEDGVHWQDENKGKKKQHLMLAELLYYADMGPLKSELNFSV